MGGSKASHHDLKAFEKRVLTYFHALGALIGVVSEDLYREGVRELLRDAGYTVERLVYYDGEGYVYGYPAEVELDIVVRGGETAAAEVTAFVKRGDLQYVKKKAELYQRTAGRPLDRVIVVAPFIHDRNPDLAKAKAKEYGNRSPRRPLAAVGEPQLNDPSWRDD